MRVLIGHGGQTVSRSGPLFTVVAPYDHTCFWRTCKFIARSGSDTDGMYCLHILCVSSGRGCEYHHAEVKCKSNQVSGVILFSSWLPVDVIACFFTQWMLPNHAVHSESTFDAFAPITMSQSIMQIGRANMCDLVGFPDCSRLGKSSRFRLQ